MTVDFLIRNWALVVASILATGILVFVLVRLYRDSDRGQLGNLVRELQGRYKAVARAQKGLDKASERLDELRESAPTVKPRHVEEAGEALEDSSIRGGATEHHPSRTPRRSSRKEARWRNERRTVLCSR